MQANKSSYKMKSTALKILPLFLTFAIGVLIVIAILSRRLPTESSSVQHYPHEHLRSSEWEVLSKLYQPTYTLKDGDTLASIATLRYGHQNYYRIIKLYNHIEDEAHIEIGTTLRLPDIATILEDEGFTKIGAMEMELILCSRAKYDRVNKQLRALRQNVRSERITIPVSIRQELMEAADDLERAYEGLKLNKPGVIKAPMSMVRQLEENVGGMRDLAEGSNDGYGYDIDIVQQRYALALTYAVIWARDGFK
jgi:hypothetical protein